jgi:prepilin-type processing-associated H-X9-DG protein
LPPLSDPNKTYSQANRDSLDHPAKGVALPDYVALAGSAPDMMNIRPDQSVIGPHGRNTRDGPWGILSGSGAFPPNQAMRHASLRDGVGNVIIVGEQSTWGIDPYYNPPLQYDLRSSFPDGGYKGAGGNYGGLNPEAEGINGSGDDRCFNITTVRYAINAVTLDAEKLPKGIVANPIGPPPRLPRDKKPKNIPQHPTGPGHNHGIFSVHVGGANVLFGDGHVEFKSEQMDLPTLQMLVTRDDGHVAKK